MGGHIREWKGRNFFFSSKVPPPKSIFGVSPASHFDGGTLNFLAKGDERSASQDRTDFRRYRKRPVKQTQVFGSRQAGGLRVGVAIKVF